MLNNDFNRLSGKNEPPVQPPLEGYDVHIYLEKGKESEKKADALVQKMLALFPDAINAVHHNGAIGPHLSLNYGVDIKPESFGKIVSWLMMNHDGLSVLVHPRTGDELGDHEDRPLWIGKTLPLNPDYFAMLRKMQRKNQGPTLH
jgi:aromatic ring-cleaving dioxygenase